MNEKGVECTYTLYRMQNTHFLLYLRIRGACLFLVPYVQPQEFGLALVSLYVVYYCLQELELELELELDWTWELERRRVWASGLQQQHTHGNWLLSLSLNNYIKYFHQLHSKYICIYIYVPQYNVYLLLHICIFGLHVYKPVCIYTLHIQPTTVYIQQAKATYTESIRCRRYIIYRNILPAHLLINLLCIT